MVTSVLFWVVGTTLPDSESHLRLLSKVVSVLSFLNYATWTGKRGVIGTLDYIAVHTSVCVFLFGLSGRRPVFLLNVLGVLATYVAWRRKENASGQILVHGIALFNLFLFGVLANLK